LATQKAFGVRQKVYRSTDLGDSWSFAGAGLPDTLYGQLRAIDSVLYQWNWSIGVAPFRSTDLGETWAMTQDTLDDIWVANGVWYAQRTAKDPRLLRSKNHGATWEPVSDPPTATSIVALAAQSNAVAASTWNDQWDYTSTDRGASWLPMGTDRVNLNVSAFAFCGPYLIAGGTSTDGGIDVSTNLGSTWFRVTPGREAQIEYLAVDSPFVYASGDGMWVSSDCGLSWKPSNDGLIREINGSDTILQYVGGMAILDSRVFVADYQGPSIYVSEDKGASWKVAGRIDQTNAQVFPLCAQGGMLYAGTYGQGIWRSTDEGKTWQQTVAGLTDTVVNDIISSRSTLFAATQDKGVFSSTDAGESWKPVNEGLLCPHVNRLLAHGEDLYAGTVSEGVWRSSLSELTRVGTEEPGSPLAFRLDQNYPNPFNPSTTIQYTVGGIRSQASGVSEVTIVIYDVLGREVAVLVHEKKAPGSYEVQFDASGLSSGLYFCRMQARQTDGGQVRDFKHTMKLMHLK